MSDETLLIVGLGNPGTEYANTRHNSGFRLLDRFCESCGADMTQNKFQGIWGTTRVCGRSILMLKPQTFMNLSGKSVVACMSFYHLAIENVLVLHDELDLPLGDLRVKTGGGAGGHNGLKSIIELTGKADFARVRIGIGRPEHNDVVNYVLGCFSAQDEDILGASLAIGVDAIKTFIARGSQASMNYCNGLFKAKKKENAENGNDHC